MFHSAGAWREWSNARKQYNVMHAIFKRIVACMNFADFSTKQFILRESQEKKFMFQRGQNPCESDTLAFVLRSGEMKYILEFGSF
jgi:hypothetical protein